MSKMEQIRKYYGVPAKRGMTVRLISGEDGFTITGTSRHGMYLNIRDNWTGTKYTVHPFDLDYLDETWVESEKLKTVHDARWDKFNERV